MEEIDLEIWKIYFPLFFFFCDKSNAIKCSFEYNFEQKQAWNDRNYANGSYFCILYILWILRSLQKKKKKIFEILYNYHTNCLLVIFVFAKCIDVKRFVFILVELIYNKIYIFFAVQFSESI